MIISEYDTLTKTRRSLLVGSLLTIVVANSTFASNSLDFFGLEILVDKEQIVKVGKLFVAFLLSIFIAQSIRSIIAEAQRLLADFDSRWEEKAKHEISEIELEAFDPNTYYRRESYESYPWDIQFSEEYRRRERRRKTIDIFATAYSMLTSVIIVYSTSLIAAAIALWDPSLILRASEFF